jgi:hypothetical protein
MKHFDWMLWRFYKVEALKPEVRLTDDEVRVLARLLNIGDVTTVDRAVFLTELENANYTNYRLVKLGISDWIYYKRGYYDDNFKPETSHDMEMVLI